jgi:O-antigen/teichoic acid export membrane protein
MKKLSETKRNVLLQTAYQIAAIIIPFITAPYISRVLGSENVGIYSYSYSIVNYFMIFAMLGLDIYGVREIAKVKDSRDDLNKTFSEIYLSHIIVSLIALIIYIVFAINQNGIYKTIFLCQTLYIIGELLNINWFFNGLSKFKITVVRNLIIKGITVLSIFGFVRERSDLIKYIFIMALGTCVSTSAVWIVRRKYVSFTKVDIKESLRHIRPMLILFVSIIAGNLNRMLDKTMLGFFGNYAELGCYEYADKFVRMPVTVITAVGTVMMSKASHMVTVNNGNDTHYTYSITLKYISIFSSLFAFGFITFGTDFSILYFGEEFAATGSLLRILAVSLFFIAWSNTLKTQYFIPHGLDKTFALLTTISAASNIIMNIIFIPIYGARGAAVATDISYFILFILDVVLSMKKIPLKFTLKNTIIPMFLGLPSFLLFLFLSDKSSITWLKLILQVGLFVLIFCITTFVYIFLAKKSKVYNKLCRKEQK